METTTVSSDSRSKQLAEQMYKLRKEKDRIAAEENAVNAALDQVREELTKIMEDLGMQKFAIDGMGTFYLSTSQFVKVLDNDKMIQWLDTINRGDIAPRKIHAAGLKELLETNMEKDLPVPAPDLAEMTAQTFVRLRLSKKEA